MEQPPSSNPDPESGRRPEIAESPEARRISEGIAEALRDGTTIDHETACLIARAITPGSGPLEQLAQSGEVSTEIGTDLEIAYEVLPDLADTWVAALDGYCLRRRHKEPVVGWGAGSAVIITGYGAEGGTEHGTASEQI